MLPYLKKILQKVIISNNIYILTLLFFLVFKTPANAQLTQNISYDIVNRAKFRIIEKYISVIGQNIQIYNGTEFSGIFNSKDNHPFYKEIENKDEFIVFEGIYYPKATLSYDLFHDNIIITSTIDRRKLILSNEKVDSFSIQKNTFYYLHPEAKENNNLEGGFYQLLYKDSVSVWAKRKKQLSKSSKEGRINKYIQYDFFYVERNNQYFRINSKKRLIKFCIGYQNDIRTFLRNNKLNFKTKPEITITEIIKYYSKIPRTQNDSL